MQTQLNSTVRRYTFLFSHGTNVYSSYALLPISIQLHKTLDMTVSTKKCAVACDRPGPTPQCPWGGPASSESAFVAQSPRQVAFRLSARDRTTRAVDQNEGRLAGALNQ